MTTSLCICGPEWRNPNCDSHGNAQQECVAEPSGNPGRLPRCTWVLATTGRCTNPATNGDVCAACEDARDKRRD